MWNKDWGNCKFHTEIRFFTPNTVIINTDKGDITVLMANNALDYIMGKIALKNPMIDTYKKAKTVVQALRRIFSNQTPPRYNKEDLKITIGVLEEISKEMVKSDVEKEKISECVSTCKLIIDAFY